MVVCVYYEMNDIDHEVSRNVTEKMKAKYLQDTSFTTTHFHLHCKWQLSSFDDDPADKENKTGKQQNVEKVAVVAKFCHG